MVVARALRPDRIHFSFSHVPSSWPLVQRSSTMIPYHKTVAYPEVATQDLDAINVVANSPYLDHSYDKQVLWPLISRGRVFQSFLVTQPNLSHVCGAVSTAGA